MKKLLIGTLFVVGIFLNFSYVHKVDAALTVTVTANPTTVAYGGSSTISWLSTGGATECHNAITKVNLGGVFGSFTTGALYATKTFSVECSDYVAAPVVCNSYYKDPVSCFTADTVVTLSNNTKVNIQDVKVGDILKGEKTNNTVLGLHQPKLNGKLYSINGGRYFVTEEHPFKTTEGWKSINPKKTEKENIGITVTPLNVGDTLVTDKGNVLIKTINSKSASSDTNLYNFILDGDHTYYADGYLVHNKTACGGGYNCGANQVCLAGTGHCGITPDRKVAGSIAADGSTPGPYEGMLCSYFSDQSSCEQSWLTHGCGWVGSGSTCAACPSSCQSGYTASCVGTRTYCVENQPCSGGVPAV